MENFFTQFDGLVLCALLLLPLLWLQRGLHREIQAIFLLLTRRAEISYMIFSLLFLPGVFLHELSHFLMARLLGVRTGRFSLIPKPMDNGRLQLGAVETASSDLIRDALIGAAPLLSGGAFVIFAGIFKLELQSLWTRLAAGGVTELLKGRLSDVSKAPDFWLWFYLTFVVSSTMLPSASDRRAWRPLIFIGILLLAIVILSGLGTWFLNHLAPYLNQALRTAALVFGISGAIHVVLILPVWLIRKMISRILGLKVQSVKW